MKMFGGVSMLKAQIYNKKLKNKQLKTETIGGGVSSPNWGIFTPYGVVYKYQWVWLVRTIVV